LSNWWASTDRRARGAIGGSVALLLGLTATSVAVWTSPDSPVNDAVGVVTALAHGDRILGERNDLLGEVVDLRGELDDRETELDAALDELAAAQQELEAIQEELAVARDRERNDARIAVPVSGPPTAPPAPTPVTAPTRAALLAPASPYFGMYTEQAPFSWATFDATALKVGAQPSMVGYFGGWDQAFRPDAVTRAWTRGMLPMLTWESRPIAAGNDVVEEPDYSLPRILDGAFDEYLRQYARDIAANGLPLAIRLDHEMNGTWYPWSERTGSGASINGNGPGDYVAMWRHVHDIFEQEGANAYVIWVWAPNRIDRLPSALRTPEHLASLYPGDEYVDWVGVSGYLRPPYDPSAQFTFDETFGATLRQLRDLTDKPIILAEVGASESGGHKAAWVESLFDGLEAPENVDVIGFSWFSLAITSYTQGERSTNDWRIDSRRDSLDAFREGLLGEGSRFVLEELGE
jgi:hypothetical protein